MGDVAEGKRMELERGITGNKKNISFGHNPDMRRRIGVFIVVYTALCKA
jgi:hypothetical protein